MRNRVVVTGIGAVTPLGNTAEEFFKNLIEGKNGIDKITKFDTEKYKVKLAAEVKDFKIEDYMDKRASKKLTTFSHYAIAAAKMAIESSGLDLEKIDKERLGTIVGSGIGGLNVIEEEHKKLLEKGPSRTSPLLIPMIISNMASGSVAIEFGARGICTNVVTACATGNDCIGSAYRALERNDADIIITGGCEASITEVAIAGFTALTALSTSEDKERASIPFDKERSGFVMGEGAGILILETLEHAEKRGAKIYAEIVGYGATCDAYHITSPSISGEGGRRAMELALKDNNTNKEDISYINAHGTSTPYNDKIETKAIKDLFGDHAYKIPVSSTKSSTGHLLGASGAIEAVISVLAINNNKVPATINYKVKDEECDLDIVPNKSRDCEVNYVMSNSLGFGGHNATLIFKKYDK